MKSIAAVVFQLLQRKALPRRTLRTAAAVAALLAGVAAAPARAHDTWLLPDQVKATAGGSATFAMTSGMAFPAEDSAIDADRLTRSGVRLAGAQQAFARLDGSEHALKLTAPLERPGVATVWVELRPRTMELTPDQVAHYVEEVGAPPEVLARWQATPEPRRWREAYRKHAKTFVRVGQPSGDRSWAEPVGSPVELVPEHDPTALVAGGDLTVRLLRDGAPATGANVALVRAGEEQAVVRATDAEGKVTFSLPHGGWYLLKSTYLRPAAAGELDWEADFATLTFEVASDGGR
jgi:uncharacterized GH25 family protein